MCGFKLCTQTRQEMLSANFFNRNNLPIHYIIHFLIYLTVQKLIIKLSQLVGTRKICCPNLYFLFVQN